MAGETVFVGSGFVAKYPEGGGNFSVVLQYLLGLRRMGIPGVWVETLAEGPDEKRCRSAFQRRMREWGITYCLLICDRDNHPTGRQYGLGSRKLRDMLAGPNTLLNLSYSLRPPLLMEFRRRILCSLDPTEVCFWMRTLEMGQSTHHEFATIGLNTAGPGSRVPATGVAWKTYFPLVDTATVLPAARPSRDLFSTIGQWYWDGNVQWEGKWRDFSKQAAFEKFFALPCKVPEARWTLAMNLAPDDTERERIRNAGWHFVHPHAIARTPARYYRFIASSTAEFSAVKLESFARSGWLSDRSAVYLAMGRPVITESTGAEPYLPDEPGIVFAATLDQAARAAREMLADWPRWSKRARQTAVECFDAPANLRRILG